MDKYICFENDGEVPVNAFKLLGASTKRDDASKIGYFGTGLKYAIAVMLREKIEFKVYSGTKEVKIGVRKTKFINDDVEVMTVNGEKTSITLDAGIDWEPWFAIREIYSNTLDENGRMKIGQSVKPEAGKTKIYINEDAAALKDVFDNWQSYFCNSRNRVFQGFEGGILLKMNTIPDFTVFRKGIRAFTSRRPSIFDYDLNQLDINESRVAKYEWQVRQKCSDLLAYATEDIIREFIKVKHSKMAEWQDEFWDFTTTCFSESWAKVLKDRLLVPANFAGRYDITDTCTILPDKLIKKLKKRFGNAIKLAGEDNGDYTILTNVDKKPLERHLEMFSKMGFSYDMDNIHIVQFMDKDIRGMADEGRVLISVELLDTVNRRYIPSTLLEEIIHARTGYGDCTRQMQGFLFDTIATLANEHYSN